MSTVSTLRRILDRKQWEPCAPPPVNSAAGSFIVSANTFDQYQYYVVSSTVVYMYDPAEDGWYLLPSPGLVGTFGAGATGQRHPWGPRGFPTAGTTTTITTNLNLQRDLRGYEIRIIAGPNAGQTRKILSNTTGANSVITVDAAYSTAITTASEFIMYTGRLYILCAGSTSAGSFKYYDLALNTWSNAGSTGAAPISLGVDTKLVATPGYYEDFAIGTATGGSSTTLVNTAKAWAVNQWANYQIRISGGTGVGQFRPIASNTATTITVSTAWTTAPDATSTYIIEGNSQNLYLIGNGSTTMYKFDITAGTWTTITPTTARAAAPSAGMGAHWVWNVNDVNWKSESAMTPSNGQYIYSFRGNGSAVVDRYNIAANSWENDIAAAPKSDVLSSANGFVYAGNYIYIMLSNTGRMIKYNILEQRMEPFSQLWYQQGTAVIGDRMFDVDYTDGATKLKFLYFITNTQNMMFRILVF